jgi:Glycine rich protein/PKD-like domain/Secretion system C-terminal sorting domain
MRKIFTFLFICAAYTIGLAQTSVTFNYTGAVQTFTVPACVTSITVDAMGAKAGNNGSFVGGNGGRVQATVPVTPGEVLQILVGQLGVSTSTSNPAVYNGGGGVFSYVSGGTAGTGGGATDIRRSPYSLNDRLVVSGGGGGGGYVNIGGHGGGLVGQSGVPYSTFPNSGGQGGTQSAGGAAGVACCSCPTYTTAGTLGQGGNGAGDGAGGGGGGGGYYGGGGSCFAGGGGGSSYTAPGVTGVTHTQGFNTGAGQVIITYSTSGGAPAQPAGINGVIGFCSGDNASFSVMPVIGATSYTWTVPPGSTINSGQGTSNIAVTLGSTPGNISVTANNSCGSSAPFTAFIAITPTPTVTVTSGNGAICAGGSYTLTASGANSFIWMPGNLSGSSVVVSPSGTTTYTVTGSTNSCVGTNTVTVTVNPLPSVSLGADITQCGGTATLNASNAGSSYLWSNGNTTQTITVNSSGTYSVTVTNGNNCSASDNIVVIINPVPLVSLGADITQCGGTATLNASNAGSSYLWSNGNTTQTITVNSSGSYSVAVTDSNGCSASDTAVVTINTLPVVVAGGVPSIICQTNASITLAGVPAGGIWSGPGVIGNNFDPGAAGIGLQDLIYNYTDSNGCSGADTATVNVDLCLGINNGSTLSMVTIYPNPLTAESGTEMFTIAVSGASVEMQLTITDAEGREVYSGIENASQNGFVRTISTVNMSAGVYLLRMSTSTEQRVEKIVIRK